MSKILAIESSCDESAVALFDPERGIVAELVHSQVDLHSLYGGVVPDLASTEHLKKLPPLVKKILGENPGFRPDMVAATNGPGLPNCLAIGICCASALALKFGARLCGVNHLRAHALSPFIPIHAQYPADFTKNLRPYLPHLGLLVSGGNSILFEMDEGLKISVLAETLDDAAGEALDKGAKLLGIAYPGAPVLEKLAQGGNPRRFDFPRGQNRKISESPAFSFSGLKTSLRYFLDKLTEAEIRESLPDIAASYQFAVTEQLRARAKYFIGQKPYKSLGLSGGVSNNQSLREKFEKLAETSGLPLLCAQKEHRGDNAGMIAFAAFMAEGSLEEERAHTLPLRPSAGL